KSPRTELDVQQARIVGAGDEHVTLDLIARLVVIVHRDFVCSGRVAGQRDVAESAAPQLANGAVDVIHTVANALERRSAVMAAGTADVLRSAIVERKKREPVIIENAGQQIRSRA